MPILHNIDPRLLAALLVTAARARSKARSGRGRRAAPGKARDPAGPDREPGETGGGEEAGHVRPAR